jgi:hypothetical protein
LTAALALIAATPAVQSTRPARPAGPLKGLPSAAGPTGEKVKALGANAWRDPLPLPANVRTEACWSAFYDPNLNADFIHAARDSTDDGTMWLYRYK